MGKDVGVAIGVAVGAAVGATVGVGDAHPVIVTNATIKAAAINTVLTNLLSIN
jgi:hypothetical protein